MNQNNSKSNNTNSTDNEELQEKQKQLNKIKDGVDKFLDVLINSTNINISMIIKTNHFSVFIGSQTKENEKERIKQAIENKMTIADFFNCENILKKLYNISEQLNLIVKKIEFSASTDLKRADDPNASQGVKFDFFHPGTKEKLNAEKCSEVPISLKLPFAKSEKLQMSLYEKSQVIKSVIDLYDKTTPGYNTRCLKTEQFDTGADTSVNYRRTKLFQNISMDCSGGCEYKGLDENKYVICNCNVTGHSEISNTAEDGALIKFPALNYDIVLCYKETYQNVNFFQLI